MIQFVTLEEFQEEFRDLHHEEQVMKLHKLLASHMLRSKDYCPLFFFAFWYLRIFFGFVFLGSSKQSGNLQESCNLWETYVTGIVDCAKVY